MAGRPSDYTPEICAEICARLIEGESLRRICLDESMPGRRTVLDWLDEHEEFRAKYARARELQGDAEHDKMADIEDDALAGKVAPDVARVVLASKQWRASKLAPKKYGDRTQLEHTGRDGGPIQYQDLSKLSDEELDQLERLSAKISSAGGGQGGES